MTWIIQFNKLKYKPNLVSSFAPLPIIRRFLQLFIPSNSDLDATIFYFVWGVVSVVIGLIGYFILKRWVPKPLAFITGGR